jgi:mannose/fructose/N-acetylgalactosamine-specific phosphotransferase system component IID
MENNEALNIGENKLTLTKKDLNQSYLLFISMAQATYSYERMQAPAFLSAMIPAINRFYPENEPDKKEERIAAAKRHMEFYNSEAWLTGPGIVGLTLSLEEERANGIEVSDEDINGVKTSLMGPCAGVGDTLRQSTLIPIIGSICISIGQAGSFAAPILYMLLTLGINYGFSYWLFNFSYKKGKAGVMKLFMSGRLEKIMTMATALGAMCLGGMASSNVKLSSSMVIKLGENSLEVQSLFDKIILNLLPLGIVFLVYYLITKKKVSSVKVILLLAILAVLLVIIGFI